MQDAVFELCGRRPVVLDRDQSGGVGSKWSETRQEAPSHAADSHARATRRHGTGLRKADLAKAGKRQPRLAIWRSRDSLITIHSMSFEVIKEGTTFYLGHQNTIAKTKYNCKS